LVNISFEYKKREVNYHYDEKDLDLTKEFSKQLKEELNDLLKAVVLFGSAVRGGKKPGSDIDVLLVLNDLDVVFSQEVISGLRILIENVAANVCKDFHITSMHLSEFWSYSRAGDPIIVNILREGMPVYDDGFFAPMQTLLSQGQIKPTKEAVWAYYMRAPKTIKSAQTHLLSALVDCYWAAIDSAHAALMHVGVIPGAPHFVADLLEEHFVEKGHLDKLYVKRLRKFYKLAKEVGHHQLKKISGKEIEQYIDDSQDFVKKMKFLLEHEESKLQ
jgi:predicted nucleotidyltransferase/uncharacterized protein (UPF0332 family)